jgi:membrane protease YdiL (CAAX protease family)
MQPDASDDPTTPGPLQTLPGSATGPGWTPRIVALLEVILCSDYPTQAALGATFAAFGYVPYIDGHLRVGFVVTLSLLDTALLLGLVMFFIYAHGEEPRVLFLGRRSVSREASVGVPLVLAALVIGIGILATIQHFAPSLHTVERNPLEELIRTPRDIWLFALVVVVAGGLREELQRAFLLHRFELWLGGAPFGVVAASVAFGAGHLLQGADAAIATGTLGAFWGIVYLRRRSIVAPVVSHSGFNLLQIVQFVLTGR